MGAPETKASILLVDDRPANLLAMQAVLEPLGQLLVSAASGREALQHLLSEEFAVILMDVQMPELDGLETARLIKSRRASRHIPIIFVTAIMKEMSHVMKGYATGGVDYLLKPFDGDILLSKVRVFVELYLRTRLLEQQRIALEQQQRALADRQVAAAEARGLLREQLLAIVGHDLRGPAGTVMLAASGLAHAGTLGNLETRDVERILRAGHRIVSLVALLVDFTEAHLGGGLTVNLVPGDLSEIVAGALDEFRDAHPAQQLEWHSGGALPGRYDPDRMAQAVANLLENAVKHGLPGTKVSVTTRRAPDGAAQLEVFNQGGPIPADVLPRIFEPFQHGPVRERGAQRSLGLGLYIVSEVVRAHGGHVSVSSEKGVTFQAVFPQHQAAQPGAPEPSTAPPVSLLTTHLGLPSARPPRSHR